MPDLVVPAAYAVPLRRKAGTEVTLANQSAVDVYFDRNPMRLNKTAVGVAPEGTRIPNTTGFIQLTEFPGLLWFRAAADTVLEVQP